MAFPRAASTLVTWTTGTLCSNLEPEPALSATNTLQKLAGAESPRVRPSLEVTAPGPPRHVNLGVAIHAPGRNRAGETGPEKQCIALQRCPHTGLSL